MTSDYQARKDAKVDRYREFAANAAARANSAHQRGEQISKRFEGGQPILVGHHSEKGARRDQARMHDLMYKSIEERDRAAYWENRARAAEMDKAIERHDPEAPRKLRDRIEILEAELARVKEINALLKRAVKPAPTTKEEALEALPLIDGLTDAERLKLAHYIQFSAGYQRFGFPSYHVTGIGANLRRYKQRLVEVEAWQNRAAALEVVNKTRKGGVEWYELSNGWYIARDRSLHNQAQYSVWDASKEQVKPEHWSWRLALSAAEQHNLPPEIPKPGERVEATSYDGQRTVRGVVHAISQDAQVITIDTSDDSDSSPQRFMAVMAGLVKRLP